MLFGKLYFAFPGVCSWFLNCLAFFWLGSGFKSFLVPRFSAMGIFDGLFGKRKPEKVSVRSVEAVAFFERALGEKRKTALNESAKRLAEIKHLLKEAREALEELENAGVSATGGKKAGRLNKIVGTAKGNTQRQLASLLEKLEPKNTSSLGEVRVYCNDSIEALQQASQFWKNVAYTKISFKEEMKLVGEKLKQLSKSFLELRKVLEDNKHLFLIEELEKKLGEKNSLEEKASDLEKDVSMLKKRTDEKTLERKRIETALANLREGEEFKGIEVLNEKKAGLLREKQKSKTEVLSLFEKVEKPLHRLDRAVQAKKVFLKKEQEILLHELLLNPFMALKRDPKAETLKEILKETKKSIESGLIDLKDREREKKMGVLSELLSFDFFGETFWKLNGIDADLLSIEKQLAELPAIREENKLSKALEQAEKSTRETREALDSKASELMQAKRQAKEVTRKIESILSQATGKSVEIRD